MKSYLGSVVIKMIDQNVINKLSLDMSIDIDHFYQKFNSAPLALFLSEMESLLRKFVEGLESQDPKSEINRIASNLESENWNAETYEFVDSMRRAFILYSAGGLHDLFIYQENEAWHPKIILKEIIYPNDIDKIDGVIEIYRGCDTTEFYHGLYGQSWSTSKEVATEFAFTHYSSQDWFDNISRCVLMATIESSDIYYSNQDKHEREIAVNTKMLKDVKILPLSRI